MIFPRSASPASVIGINGAGGADGAPLCAKADAPTAQLRTARAATKERNTGGGLPGDSLLEGAHLSQNLAAMAGDLRFSEGSLAPSSKPCDLLGEVARDECVRDGSEGRHLGGAAPGRVWAARPETTTARRADRRRQLAAQHGMRAGELRVGIRQRHGAHERLRVRMARVRVEIV